MYKDPKLIVFFYVDNIVVLAKPGHLKDLEDFEKKLLKRYQIRALGNLEFFCGIRVIRDREEGQIWLCQDSYVDKLREKFQPPKGWSTKPITTPLPLEELVPAEKYTANPATSLRYSQIVGSIGYIANATRPDLAKAHCKLAEFLVNPTVEHLTAAYQTLSYLVQSKTRALLYNANIDLDESYIIDNEPPIFIGASDASFGADKGTRKSSQGYIFFLYGGPIDWRATLQRCVTKSATESELLAASSAGTELIWWWRTFEEIGFNPGHRHTLHCDNQQTVRLVKTDAPRLKTQLKHVDIQCLVTTRDPRRTH